jgi:uncharacterized protein (TIGR04255 family)
VKPIQLSKPPIREAVFDIQVEGAVDLDQVKELAEAYGKELDLKKVTPIRAGIFGVIMFPGQPLQTHAYDEGVIGLRIEDDPTTQIVQFRINGFTYSCTGTYDDWSAFRGRAIQPAKRFLALPGVKRITRIALRYINVIQFPNLPVNLDDYLPAAPTIPENLPQIVSGFISRVSIAIPEDQLTAVITQASEEAPLPVASVILDIDVFRSLSLPAGDVSWEQMFERIREWKNRIFFEFVNEKTVDLYK